MSKPVNHVQFLFRSVHRMALVKLMQWLVGKVNIAVDTVLYFWPLAQVSLSCVPFTQKKWINSKVNWKQKNDTINFRFFRYWKNKHYQREALLNMFHVNGDTWEITLYSRVNSTIKSFHGHTVWFHQQAQS